MVCAKREDGSGIIASRSRRQSLWRARHGLGLAHHDGARGAEPEFPHSIVAASGGRLVPNPGGVLIRDAGNAIIGAVGISGDTGDNDEIIAVAGIEAAGLKADPGGAKK